MKSILMSIFAMVIVNASIVEEAEDLTITSNKYYKSGELKSVTENFYDLKSTEYFDENQDYLGFRISYDEKSILEVIKYNDRKCIYARIAYFDFITYKEKVLHITDKKNKIYFYNKRFTNILVNLRNNLKVFERYKTKGDLNKSVSELHKDMDKLLDDTKYDFYSCVDNGQFFLSDDRSFYFVYEGDKLLNNNETKGFPIKKINPAYANKLKLDFFHFRKFYEDNTF